MTKSKCGESDGVRKVRLKTTSGVLTLRYRSSQSSREADNSPSGAFSVEKLSQGSSPVSGFGSLPELFEFSDQFSKGEGSDGYSYSLLDIPPDFSTYDFWASESGHSWPPPVALSDTFSRCEPSGMIDHAPPGLEPIIVDDAHCQHGVEHCPTKLPDPNFQSTVKSPTSGQITKNRKSYWDFPLELEEDIFECANSWNLLREVTDGRDVHGEGVVDDFLVDRTPDVCDDVANAENLDSSVLVYAPNRYLDNTACIFQSPPADLKSDIQKIRTVDCGQRIHDSQNRSGGKRGTVKEECLEESLDIRSKNSDTTASCIEESDDLQDGTAKHSRNEVTDARARVLRLADFVNHRRRRFSALRGKRSKFPKRSTLTSLDKRSPKHSSREIKLCRRLRSPGRSSDTARRLFKATSSSDSQPAEQIDDNSENGRRLLHSDRREVHVVHRAEISRGNLDNSSFKATPKRSSTRGAPTLRFSPLRDIQNTIFSRDAASTFNLSSNPCLLRRKRTRYAEVIDSADNSNKTGARFLTENLSQDSPNKIKLSEATTLDGPPTTKLRSPLISRKKIRTSRGRPLIGSPSSARKLNFYGKIIYEGSSLVLEDKPSQDRESQSVTKSGETKGRRKRLPLPASSVETLQGWLHDNLSDPYPSRQEKEDLALQTGLKMSQIDNWLGNARQKLKLKSRAVKDICSESSFSPEQPKKQSKRGRSYPTTRL